MSEKRFYREWCENKDLVSFDAMINETDLYIKAEKNLKRKSLKAISKYRLDIEKYIKRNPLFLTSLEPIPLEKNIPFIVKKMIEASVKVGVGPMAAVAGAIAEFVGKSLLKYSKEIIVENGGDIFIKTSKIRYIGIYAGNSFFTKKISIEILPEKTPLGICTSSGTVGHSLSFGKADAITIISPCTSLSDAAATAVGNLIKNEADIALGIEFVKKIKGLKGVLIIKNDKMGIWGDVKIRKD